jgi:hypothetical protein
VSAGQIVALQARVDIHSGREIDCPVEIRWCPVHVSRLIGDGSPSWLGGMLPSPLLFLFFSFFLLYATTCRSGLAIVAVAFCLVLCLVFGSDLCLALSLVLCLDLLSVTSVSPSVFSFVLSSIGLTTFRARAGFSSDGCQRPGSPSARRSPLAARLFASWASLVTPRGIAGNEKADEWAKLAADETYEHQNGLPSACSVRGIKLFLVYIDTYL